MRQVQRWRILTTSSAILTRPMVTPQVVKPPHGWIGLYSRLLYRPLPKEIAMEKTGHSGKYDLVCVSRAGGDPVQDTNEIGKSGVVVYHSPLT